MKFELSLSSIFSFQSSKWKDSKMEWASYSHVCYLVTENGNNKKNIGKLKLSKILTYEKYHIS